MSKKEDILNATKEIVSTEGFTGATIANILKKAGTGYGTLYNYFSSKEDLYRELYVDISFKLGQYMNHLMTNLSNPEEVLRQLILNYINFCTDNIKDFYTLEAFMTMTEMCSVIAEAEDTSMQQQFCTLIESCIKEGIIKNRDMKYTQKIMFGNVAIFIKYHHDNDIEISSLLKQEAVATCMNALK